MASAPKDNPERPQFLSIIPQNINQDSQEEFNRMMADEQTHRGESHRLDSQAPTVSQREEVKYLNSMDCR